jgi:thioredoxin 1
MSWPAYLVLALTALLAVPVLWTALAARGARGKAVDPLADALPGLDAHKARAVVYCFSQHCGPCRKMSPQIDRLRQRHPNVFKLDILQHPRAAQALGVHATPTTLLVEDGKVLKALLGAGGLRAVEVFLAEA